MKMLNIHGETVTIDTRQSKYPIRAISKSKLQGETGQLLKGLFPREIILEEFPVPGSRFSVDFFVPSKDLVVEVQGEQHDDYNAHFHGDRNEKKFAKQAESDRTKAHWAELNGFELVELRKGMSHDDIRSEIQRSV